MKFGLFLNLQHPVGQSMVERLQGVLEQVRAARESGFDLVSAGQHYLSSPYQMLQTLPLLARVAPEAGQMQVAASVILLPLLNPVDVAEQAATLDVICEGRFILGVGIGYREEEFAAFGVPKGQRVSRFVEALTVIKRLWTEDELEFQGEHFRIPRVRIALRPVQKPHPPVWIAANNDAAVERVARMGYPWLLNPHVTGATLERQMALYRRALTEAGHAPPVDLPLVRELYVAETREKALEEAAPYLSKKYGVYHSWGQHKVLPGRDDFRTGFEELLRDRFIVGGPEECAEELRRYADRLGNTHVLLRIQWPGMPNDMVLRQIDLLGKRVIPRLR